MVLDTMVDMPYIKNRWNVDKDMLKASYFSIHYTINKPTRLGLLDLFKILIVNRYII